MIDVIDYGNGLTCTVFDEPFEDYQELILDANLDTHRLAKNYRADLLKDMEYMCLWKMGSKRVLHGLQRDPLLPNNVARAYTRLYMPADVRDSHSIPREESYKVASFYTDHPKYHERLGIDTLFFTREVKGNRKDLAVAILTKWSGFVKVEEPRYYRQTLQHFYVLGDTSFVTAFPLSLVGPSN